MANDSINYDGMHILKQPPFKSMWSNAFLKFLGKFKTKNTNNYPP